VTPGLAIIFAILSGVAFAVMGLGYKLAERWHSRTLPFAIVFMSAAGVISLGIALLQPTAWHDWRLWAMGSATGLLVLPCIMLVVRTFRLGSAAIAWTVLNLSLLIPILMASFLLKQPLLPIDAVSLLAFALMLLAFARGMSAEEDRQPSGNLPKYLTLLTILYVGNGLVQCLQQLEGTLLGGGSSGGYSVIFFGTGALLGSLLLWRTEGRLTFAAGEIKAGLLAGACSATGVVCFLCALGRLPSIVAFPISQGISLLGGVVLTAGLFRERLNLLKVFGLALGVVVLCVATRREDLNRRLVPATSTGSAYHGQISPAQSAERPGRHGVD